MAPPGSAADRAKVILLGSGTPIPDPSSLRPVCRGGGERPGLSVRCRPRRRPPRASRRREVRTSPRSMPPTSPVCSSRISTPTIRWAIRISCSPPGWSVAGQPLEVYGPEGMAAMTEHLKEAYAADITVRTEGPEGLSKRSLAVNVHEISNEMAAAGPVYKDANVTVRAFAVPHGTWPQAFGYAIDAAGRSIVISGDTAPTDAILEACHECDILVHEVYSADRFDLVFGARRGQYHSTFHTSTKQLAEIACESQAQAAGALSPVVLRPARSSRPGKRNPPHLHRHGSERPRPYGVLVGAFAVESCC